MRSKSSFNKYNDLDLNEIKSNQWQDKETDSLTVEIRVHLSGLSSFPNVLGEKSVYFRKRLLRKQRSISML